jgi:hypothetical protein
MKCEDGRQASDFVGAPIGSQVDREPPSDIFHGHTPAGKIYGPSDFASSEAQTETDEEMIEITARGKNNMPGYEKSLKEAQIKEFTVHIREPGHKK